MKTKEIIILLVCVLFLLFQVILYLINFPWNLSSRSEDWAAFSTFFGLSFSFASALLIFLTYRNQTNMSSVLQFESIFFQWHQQHRDIYNGLAEQIISISNNVVIPFIYQHKGEFDISQFSVDDKNKAIRDVMPYYRSLYHLLKYINQSDIIDCDGQKKKYVDIIQSQMTDAEYNVVLFLLLCDHNKNRSDKFNKYSGNNPPKGVSWIDFIDKYHLLKNIYYPTTNENYTDFVKFMHITFPNSRESFHFLQ